MPQTLIGYCICNMAIPANETERAMASFPDALRSRIDQYGIHEDRVVRIAGWMLLRHLLTIGFGFSGDPLGNISRNAAHKPVLTPEIDFSVSHSGCLAICAVTDKGKVGVDIEKMQNPDVADYTEYLQPAEYNTICAAESPSEALLQVWARKEALLKASGTGVLYPMIKIDQQPEHVLLEADTYFLQNIVPIPGYVGALATNFPDVVPTLISCTWQELIQTIPSDARR
jgi:4'-phosphopantetheinyl transferase